MVPNKDEIDNKLRMAGKAMITHLYKIVGKMTPQQYTKYDYLMNFGVSIGSKVNLQKAVENACNYNDFKSYLGIVLIR
jgi:hypothetical protein